MNARFIFSLVVTASIAHADPEFVGLISTQDSDIRFIVTVANGQPPQWVRLGGSVGGFIVSEYRAKEETLVLRKDSADFVLKMKGSRIQNSDYSGRLLTLGAAKQLIASMEGWYSGDPFRTKDGRWFIRASQRVGNQISVHILPLAPESIPAGMAQRN